MTEQFWYGLLALPALLIIIGLAVATPLGALWLIDKAQRWKLRRINHAEKFTHTWTNGSREMVDDSDGRLQVAAAIATGEKVWYTNSPFGHIVISTRRHDRRAAYRLRALLEKDLLRDDSERGMEPL